MLQYVCIHQRETVGNMHLIKHICLFQLIFCCLCCSTENLPKFFEDKRPANVAILVALLILGLICGVLAILLFIKLLVWICCSCCCQEKPINYIMLPEVASGSYMNVAIFSLHVFLISLIRLSRKYDFFLFFFQKNVSKTF